MEINYKISHYELKLKHRVKRQPEAKDFNINVNVKILRQESSDPLEEICFSSTVDDFVWEDEDCPYPLYNSLVNVGIIEAQFLVSDIISYVSHEVLFREDDYKGIFTLIVEVRLPPEPVELNYAQEETNKKMREGVPVESNHVGWEFIANSFPISIRKIYSKFGIVKRLVGFVTWERMNYF